MYQRTTDTLVDAKHGWEYGALGKVQVLPAPGECFLDYQDTPLQQEARVSKDREMAVEEEQGMIELGGSSKRRVLHK